jgi:putative membrane protein
MTIFGEAEPWLLALLAAAALLYGMGVARLWRSAGAGRGIRRGEALSFALGWLVLCGAIASPLDGLADRLFSAHMIQHELMMTVAAPCFVLGRPLEAWAWALPAPVLRALAAVARARPLARCWSAITDPLPAWSLQAIVLWLWHAPVLFDAALASEAVHVAQHACFLAAALLLWWSVLGRGSRRPDGASIASLFTTMMHSGALGALLTFAPHPWYAHYTGSASLGALEDQQLGGLVMWVPGGLAYLAAGLAIVGSWLRNPEKGSGTFSGGALPRRAGRGGP